MADMSATPVIGRGETANVFDAIIVGAGFAGLYMLHRLRGLGLSTRVYEAGGGVGGTWFWNRYPGARCDVESLQYSYSFSESLEQEWQWTERYASQPEIERYLNHVADRFALRGDIQFDTRVVAATFDEASKCWTIHTDRGDRVTTRFCVMATGCLSAAKIPDYQGIDAFRGKMYHTGHWPAKGVDFMGRKVGVIGTGSSAIQCIPHLARQASHLFVFQRTPNFSVPAHNGPLSPEVVGDWKANRAKYRHRDRRSQFGIRIELNRKSALGVASEDRQREYEARWRDGGFAMLGAFADIILNQEANETAAEFVRSKIRAIVNDPAVAKKLAPIDYPFAAKRLCVDTDYYATFNRDNVTLIDVRATPIREITCTGVRTVDADHALDSIVFATGYDAMTGALRNIDIRGRAGVSLKQHWSGGPRTYLGIMIARFPNLFTITGPGSPSVVSNMVLSIEQHVEWISDCIGYLRNRQLASIEATVEAENAWVAHVNEVASYTLFPRAHSWYMGANIPGKPRVFMPYIGGVGVYRQKCDVIAAHGYEGFALRP
jgi:cation diffusion facilitator CzcD-associated flavoprotein CzcO